MRERPKSLAGTTYRMITGCGALYVTVNEMEVFVSIGKAGGCATAQAEAIGRLISLSLRSGVTKEKVIKQLMGISCHSPAGLNEDKMLSCADAIAKALKEHKTEGEENATNMV